MAKNVLFRKGISLDNKIVKKWQDAITRSNVQPSRTSGLPLILWQHASTRLVDIFSTDITAFETISSRTKCMYTKGGWLLFRRFEYPHNTNIASFFLQNAISGARIDLPDMKGEEWKGRSFFMDDTGVFSVKTERGENLYQIDWPKGLQMVPKGNLRHGSKFSTWLNVPVKIFFHFL